MFLSKQPKSQVDQYIDNLQKIGALSALFSDNNVPYLYYRVAEIVFCRAFGAENHSRSDTSVDASKVGYGFGLKTFLNGNGKTFQKIAEFNKNRELYADVSSSKELVQIVSQLRNERLAFARRTHSVQDILYHCVARAEGEFLLYEEQMSSIQVNKIKLTKDSGNTIHFTDGNADYNFNISKSTLLKRFYTPAHPTRFDVHILDDPFEFLEQLRITATEQQRYIGSVILPLYSTRGGKHVQEKSGLNQWNAAGRKRHPWEVYIPIPIWIHRVFPNFFPPRDQDFNLTLPNGSELFAKVCQDNSKALMSNPNKDLGEWLLQDVLDIPQGELVTYDMLETIGIDSVEISKIDDGHYDIDFRELGTYEEFEEDNNL